MGIFTPTVRAWKDELGRKRWQPAFIENGTQYGRYHDYYDGIRWISSDIGDVNSYFYPTLSRFRWVAYLKARSHVRSLAATTVRVLDE